ncbi:hypothetical protein [Fulvivirga sedimenti]|uniref:DUF2460 domain-containing protein n=1 Tax=Fulvivirga sedimenti TaxID=2879465 RepID=A0A9X1HNV2_9BACT|nr:hypothetical protein [Fulvivirga sedimenti]MCA6073619.1 hypothetical protein [Fulvivirga sedimenti]
MRSTWIITGILLFLMHPAFSQHRVSRCSYVHVFNEPVRVDSLSIVPGSVFSEPAGAPITYDFSTGKITISMAVPPDSIKICYQVFPVSFTKEYRNRQLRIFGDTAVIARDTIRTRGPSLRREEIFTAQGLQKSGTISRGVSFGNNQDVFVNSTLNLNLDGRLTDDLNIRASITDQNIPFQPEGNTQQLQDFDNVFVEIYNDRLSLLAGDIVLRQRPSHFLRYYKNVQGGRASINYDLGGGEASSSLGISVAKGQFESTLIPAREGILGPYQIPGPNNQPFVIILANSERIFLDGKLLERGFNRDYVIDYNQGQVTFTNRILITEFSRIRIDYEYSDQNYNRSILAASHEQQNGKWKINAQAYREGDNRNRPLFGDLSQEEKIILSEAGDDLSKAITSGADSVAFSNEFILYERRDTTLTGGETEEIFLYSTDMERATFRVRFTQTGENGGNYVLDRITANGRIYKWVAPVNGVPQGNYIPFIQLPAPNKRQMVTLGAGFEMNEHEEVFAETAVSSFDQNLYSDIGNTDNNGFAIKSGITSRGRKVSFLNGYTWNALMDFEFDDENFRPIDRFRDIEFNRDWNYDPRTDTLRNTEQIINAGFGIKKDAGRAFQYGLTYRKRGEQVDGLQHRLELDQQWKSIKLRSQFFQMNNDVETFNASWTRLSADLSVERKKWVPGYIFALDKNRQSYADRDTSAMYFTSHEFYVHQGAESKWLYDFRYTYRNDERPLNGVIQPYSTSNTFRTMIGRDFEYHRLQAMFTYRAQDLLDKVEDEETISSRVEWQGSWLKNVLRTDVTYAVSNSQELRREYVFIRVPAGEGTHTWRDLNVDGIQDFNEFFIAVNPDERNFAKIFVPTNDFVTAFQNLLIAQFQITLPESWKDRGGVPALLAKFSNNSSWTADNKITSDDIADKLLAFARAIDEEDILAQRNIFRSTTFFNRANAVYGMEFTVFHSRQKQLLSSGVEGAENRTYNFILRYNPSRIYNLKLRAGQGNKTAFSDFLPDRNFLIRSKRINPEASWQPGIHHRFTLQYMFERRENVADEVGNEQAVSNEFQFDYRFSKASSSVMNARVSLISIDFEGIENSPVGYELLNALNPGRNVTWSLVWQQKITKGLQLNLSYDGRASENNRVIHTGRVQVSALF